MKPLTRRELAAGISASALLLTRPAIAQQPQVAPIPASAADELKAAQAQLHDIADQLDKFPLPMSTEPAVIFKP